MRVSAYLAAIYAIADERIEQVRTFNRLLLHKSNSEVYVQELERTHEFENDSFTKA
jgi:hypothetical protein